MLYLMRSSCVLKYGDAIIKELPLPYFLDGDACSLPSSMKGGRTAPRNFWRQRHRRNKSLSSMKGGRTAPRNCGSPLVSGVQPVSSMKGGRTAPRNMLAGSECAEQAASSMKGGRTAPRNNHTRDFLEAEVMFFNEGGADCPPKP